MQKERYNTLIQRGNRFSLSHCGSVSYFALCSVFAPVNRMLNNGCLADKWVLSVWVAQK